jgi:hypothetical protein
LKDKHIRFDHALIYISWTLLLLSLPATVAGYIGCFTSVSGSGGNGPLIWLGVPRFDEGTYITLRLELAKDQPFVTTEKNVEVLAKTGKNTLALVLEREFLEWITSYTGPVEQFQRSENLALYFRTSSTLSDGLRHL